MADVNYGLALGIKTPEQSIQYPDIGKALSTYSSLQMSQAHAGLYSLEAAKQAMTIQGLNAYQQKIAGGAKPEDAIDTLSFSPELQKSALEAAKQQNVLRSNAVWDKTHNASDIYDPITQMDVRQKDAAIGLDTARTAGENLANTGKRFGLMAQTAAGTKSFVDALPTQPPQSDPFNQPPPQDPQVTAALAHVAGGVANNLATGVVPPAQANAAWGHALDGMVKNGLITPQQAEQWRIEGYNPARINQLMNQGLTPEQYQTSSGATETNKLAAETQATGIRQGLGQPQEAETQRLRAETLATADRLQRGQVQETARQTEQGKAGVRLDTEGDIAGDVALKRGLATNETEAANIAAGLPGARAGQVAGADVAARAPNELGMAIARNQLEVSAKTGKQTDPVAAYNAVVGALAPGSRSQATLASAATDALAKPAGPGRDAYFQGRVKQLRDGSIIDQATADALGGTASDTLLNGLRSPLPTQAAAMPVPGNTPLKEAEDKGTGEELAKILPKLNEDADAASDANVKFSQLERLAVGWRMGKWTEVEKDVRDSMKSFANFFGIKSTSFDMPLANQQAWFKTSNDFVRIATKETSPRASFQELGFIQKTQVGQDMSEGGMKLVGAQVHGLADFKIAKAQAAQTWKDNPAHGGSIAGFNTDWNAHVTSDGFMFRRMDPVQQDALMRQLGKTEAGRADLRRFSDEIKYAHAATINDSEYK